MAETKNQKLDTSKLRKFAQYARTALLEQVGNRLNTVLAEGSLARRENPKAVAALEEKFDELAGDDGVEAGFDRVVEMAAYTWFNRFCALRYMDVNRYTKIGIISPADGQFQPEILAEAKMGHMDEKMIPDSVRQKVNRFLDETDPSDDPQGEAYRLLLVAACNHYHSLMPTMFQKIADYTELLLPDDLLSGNSIPAYTREALLPINCSPEYTNESVEVIGWLYQFYISEKKDDVFAALKKGKKITPENIPAATQLFTPHWIVRYLVENSLGRLWMLNHPDSRLAEQMDYYIKPEEPETDFLQISSPEEIKICDPACGSGHMLTYAFDLLYAIYEEQGYQATDIPRLILTHNLYGIEIDQRAGALAAFALTMKAREKYRRFLTGGKVVQPNICVLQNISIDPEDLSAYMDVVGTDLLSGGLQGVVNQWEEADNFGSLIRPLVADVSEVLELLSERQMGEDLFLSGVHQKVLTALRQADYLSPKYHVVVANPPYMGSKGMATELRGFLKDRYPSARHDFMTCFMQRAETLGMSKCIWGMITLPSWMFINSFESFRRYLVETHTIINLLHLGRGIFGSDFGSVAFVCSNQPPNSKSTAVYRKLYDDHVDVRPVEVIEKLFFDESVGRFVFQQENFEVLHGTPIAYWASEAVRRIYDTAPKLDTVAKARIGLQTGDNNRFLREWHEVSFDRVGLNLAGRSEAAKTDFKWYPYNKGGSFRRWAGNQQFVVNWEHDGKEIIEYQEYLNSIKPPSSKMGIANNSEFYFRPSISWSKVTAGGIAFRHYPEGFIFDVAGTSLFAECNNHVTLLALLNSSVVSAMIEAVNPTVNFEAGKIAATPVIFPDDNRSDVDCGSNELVKAHQSDWDSFENSWNFENSILATPCGGLSLNDAYEKLRAEWQETTDKCRNLEVQNNQFFVDLYGLGQDASSEVPIEDVTLTSNPYYRYDEDKSESELEALLLADTMREFISYAVGCMLGRYSLDKPGLILANQGESLREYFRLTILDFGLKGEYDDSRLEECMQACTFAPDEDNVIPLLEGEWFEDDITERFKQFLKVTFGEEHYDENLRFLENALFKDNETARKPKTIRDYFLKEFYNHHVKLYKKRPIYWLFSSKHTGGAGAFNALIYMHRYQPDTVSSVLRYLRDLRDKLSHAADHQQMVADSGGSTNAEKTKALKQVTALKKDLKELDDYERKVLFPLAGEKVEIDLDDGVKVNYNLFGKALKKITGVTGKA